MNWGRIIGWIFKPAKQQPADIEPVPGERNPGCPYCRGLGYDASGYTCTCLKEKK